VASARAADTRDAAGRLLAMTSASQWRHIDDLSSPDELAMPSLASIDTDEGNLGSLLKVVFDHEQLTRDILGRNVTYVRLVGRAVRAYERARRELITDIESQLDEVAVSIAASSRCTDELETLFGSVHRALRILWTLKGMVDSPVSNSHLLNQRVFRTVNDLRDASEHIEERLIGKQPHAFTAYDMGFAYAGYRVEWAEVASWLEHLTFVADHVINIVEVPRPSTT
jgi:hypothetical protein